MVKVNKDLCNGCGKCIEYCPMGAIKLVNGKAVIDAKKCIRCMGCASVCPRKAIKE